MCVCTYNNYLPHLYVYCRYVCGASPIVYKGLISLSVGYNNNNNNNNNNCHPRRLSSFEQCCKRGTVKTILSGFVQIHSRINYIIMSGPVGLINDIFYTIRRSQFFNSEQTDGEREKELSY